MVGPITWALDSVLPRLIAEHGLESDPRRLDAALLRGQEQAARGQNDMEILPVLFDEMGWDHRLIEPLAREVFEHYTPSLFDDTLPFLERVGGVYVLSNNKHAPEIAADLGITPYVTEFFTPKLLGIERGKPHRELWDAVLKRVSVDNPLLVGDNPWLDEAFAAACGIECCLVDRLDRFAALTSCRRVRSLAEIDTTV